MDVEARPLRQPKTYPRMLVGSVVVDDQRDIEVCGHGLVDALEKTKKLLMPVPPPALSQYHSGGNIQLQTVWWRRGET